MSTFRAMWPIVDPTLPFSDLVDLARAELPSLAAQAGARVTGDGTFKIADSCRVPGSGRQTANVLLYEAAAESIDKRIYRRAA